MQHLLDRVKNLDLYLLLGIETHADETAIRKAYKKKALQWHPDKNPDKPKVAEMMFLQIADALQVLTISNARKVYDNAQKAKKAEELRIKKWIENLVCEICKSHTRPRKKLWYQCMDRHQICQDCCTKRPMNKCSCGKTILVEHCKKTEKWLNAKGVKFNCKNKKNGCQEVFDENALEDHESDCPFRIVPCLRSALVHLWTKCEANVQFQNTITHYEEHKGFEYVGLEDCRMNTKISYRWNVKPTLPGYHNGYYWHPRKVKFDNETFLLAVKTEDNIVYMWVYILASPKRAKKYSYTLKFFGSKSTTTFEGKVAAIDETFGDLCEAGKCFGMPFKLFESQLDKDRCFTYSMMIQNVK